jgi:molybdopterin-guanine dinucleotide biosynthesis protein A
MLMIGSAGAKVGKTELACALIKKFSKSLDITGVKVTTIRAKDEQCPRGGQGCGVCSSLDANFCIMEETDSSSRKDTARLLNAGASRVFWLRVMKTHLKDGLSALVDIIGPNAVSICESNSLRQVVEPGLFLMVKGRGHKVWKSSARELRDYADRIVTSDRKDFDLDIERIQLVGEKWAIKEQATAIILAGGDSTRIGKDKSMLPIGGEPMIKHICDQLRPHFDQILVSSDDKSKYDFLDVEIIPDRLAGQGPLMGIASALKASANEVNFVIACDIPEVDMSFVRTMLRQVRNCDAVVPTTGPSQYEPLFAVYKKDVFTAAEDALLSGSSRIMDALTSCKVRYIELTGAQQIKNINTVNDYWEFVNREK